MTLLGPPGIGKTRLADEFARTLSQPALTCDLAGAGSVDGIVAAVGRALGLPLADGPDAQVERLGRAMAARGSRLVLLDHFDQATIHSTATVGRWLSLAPGARFLATSRERLGIDGEVVLELEPMTGADAAQLFLDRARLLRPAWKPTFADARLAREIGARLENIPLAIELAASRARVVSLKDLAERLSSSLDILEPGPGRPGRQATMRAAIEWSWSLLTLAERSALAQLSVFRGGFELCAAEAVVYLSRLPDPPRTVDVLQALRDRSLVHSLEPRELPGTLRFRLYGCIREFASEKLETMGEGEAARARHASHYLATAEALCAEVERSGSAEAIAVLSRDQENLLAIARSKGAPRPGAVADALRAVLALDCVLAACGPAHLRLSLLDETLPSDPTAVIEPALLAAAHLARGSAHLRAGAPAVAQRDLERARELARGCAQVAIEGRALAKLVAVHALLDRPSEARAAFALARPLLSGKENRRALAALWGDFSIVSFQLGRPAAAIRDLERSLHLLREVGDRALEGRVLHNHAVALHQQGRLQEARKSYLRTIALARALRDPPLEGATLINLGTLALELGERARSAALFSRALRLVREAGDRRFEGILLRLTAARVLLGRRAEDAVSLCQRAIALHTELGDRRGEALAQGWLGAAEAHRGEASAAEAAFEQATTLIGGHEDPVRRGVVSLLLGALDVLLARVAQASGDEETRARHLLEARKRATRARTAYREEGASRDRAPSLLERSAELRLALLFLEHTLAREGVRARSRRSGESPGPRMWVGLEESWFRIPGRPRVDLGRHRSLRLVLGRLVAERMTTPGRAVPLEALLEAGWPGERVLPDSGRARVYVAVSTLKKLGLDGLLIRRGEGYLLDPRLELHQPLERDG